MAVVSIYEAIVHCSSKSRQIATEPQLAIFGVTRPCVPIIYLQAEHFWLHSEQRAHSACSWYGHSNNGPTEEWPKQRSSHHITKEESMCESIASDDGYELLSFITLQVVGPFIDSSNLLFGDYSPNIMVITNAKFNGPDHSIVDWSVIWF